MHRSIARYVLLASLAVTAGAGCSGKGSHLGTSSVLVTSLQVRLFNVDDVEDAYLNGAPVLEAHFLGDTGYVDLSDLLLSGENDLELTDTNGGGVWTFGFQVVANGETIFDDECGTPYVGGSVGCANGDATLGVVYDQVVTVDAP